MFILSYIESNFWKNLLKCFKQLKNGAGQTADTFFGNLLTILFDLLFYKDKFKIFYVLEVN